MTFLVLGVALLVILAGAEAFTNALEHLGSRLKISEGVTGSIFAAVGTAMPETMVPIVAIFSDAGTAQVREEVGVGAILGAPLMLSTLALLLMALFAAPKRGWRDTLRPEHSGLKRDLSWFLFAFGLSAAAIFIPHALTGPRHAIALALVVIYFLYVLLTVRASARLVRAGHATEADHALYLLRPFGRGARHPAMAFILLQLGLGFALIFFGAHAFVDGVEDLSAMLGVSALVLSLLIIPVATELPEKINSVLWIRRRRDTLAFGNITGAMVFQGSLLPAIGITLTPWEPRAEVLWVIALTLLASAYLYVLARRGTLHPYHLLFNGACYLAYVAIIAI